jgi:PAS domain S-box-containing protein
MGFDFWGFTGKFAFNMPTRSFGYVLFGLYLLVFLLFFVYYRSRNRTGYEKDASNTRSRALLWTLCLLAPLANALFCLSPHGGRLPETTLGSLQPTIPILGAIPWILAGGMLGGWQAMLVGLLGGLFRAGWGTHSLLTPFHIAIQAAFVTWLLERDYDDRLGGALRHPLISSVIGGLLFGILTTMEGFLYTGGDLYEGSDFVLSNLAIFLIAEMVEVVSAGLIAEILRFAIPKVWYRPRWLVPGPYRRSLTGRILSVFLLLGVVASSILLYGDWLLVRSSAQELVQSQMMQTAYEAGDGIPYFIQTGRSLTQRLAAEIDLSSADPTLLQEQLERGLTLVPFFNGLSLFDLNKNGIAHTPSQEWDAQVFSLILEDAIQDALDGIPGERILPPFQDALAARLVFLAPVQSSEGGNPIGVIAGWTDLSSNPFLLPTINRIREITPGTAFVVDDSGRIVIHPDPTMVMEYTDVDLETGDQILSVESRAGTKQLIFVYAVEGYSWYVVFINPQIVVDHLAISLGLRLSGVLVLLGGIVIAVLYVISKRLAQPMELMASAAESIARGNLDRPVPDSGKDEIGVLAASFERMRTSLQSRIDEMDLLLAVSQRVASSFDLNDFLPPILEGMRELTKANIVRLVIAPERGGDVRLEVYQAGKDPGNWASLDRQILSLSRERGQFILENPSRAQAVLNVNGLRESIAALMALPIQNEDKYVGTIWLGHRQPHVFSANEINLFSIIGGQLGVAITNAHLYHQAEAERMRLKAVLGATPDAVLVTDQEGQIVLANPAAETVLRVKPEQALGKPAAEVVDVPDVVDLLLKSERETHTGEIDLNEDRVLFASVTPIEGNGAGATGKVCVLWDITHYKKLDMLKSDFVATVSHDLRMPLTLMRGYVKMLSMVGATNSQQRDYIEKILQSADQMTRLVDNLLDLGRIEAGLGLKPEEIEVEGIINDVIHAYRPQAVNKQVSMSIDIGQDLTSITADATLLRQALANLVENAIHFSKTNGRVTIRARQEKDHLLLSVEDTGLGIAPADQARLFEKFYRVRKQDGEERTQSGLGLAIVKSIVEQHGGRVTVESRLGAGSTFTMEIPIHPDWSRDDLDKEGK